MAPLAYCVLNGSRPWGLRARGPPRRTPGPGPAVRPRNPKSKSQNPGIENSARVGWNLDSLRQNLIRRVRRLLARPHARVRTDTHTRTSVAGPSDLRISGLPLRVDARVGSGKGEVYV